LRPKYSDIGAPDFCSKPSNIRKRNLQVVSLERGAAPNNVVTLASSRPEEISLDSPQTGGLATSAWHACSGTAQDTDGSGTLSIHEMAACMQTRINERLAQSNAFTGQHIVVSGNGDFSPLRLALAPSTAPTEVQPSPLVATQSHSLFPLKSLLAQADARHRIHVSHQKTPLKIGKDAFDIKIKSERGGFVYLILQSSDQASTYILFPNALDEKNQIKAGEWMQLPRPQWRLTSQGPAGLNKLLVMVTDRPRDLSKLSAMPEGPFVKTLNNRSAAANLSWLMGQSAEADAQQCASSNPSNGLTGKAIRYTDECSDAFGAAWVEFSEEN
jgi:hypothetical protein